ASFHSFMTNASLTEMHTISSTPCAFRTGASWLKRGTCEEEHVGVNAPGSENTTTVLPAKISSLDTSTHSCSPRVRNVTRGTRCPSRFSSIVISLDDFSIDFAGRPARHLPQPPFRPGGKPGSAPRLLPTCRCRG